MATNASTWFYTEPEHEPYLIEERVNHTFWSNRIQGLYLDCVSATPPFRMVGDWNDMPIEIEWVPQDYFTLMTEPGTPTETLIVGIREILGFVPTISYVDLEGRQIAEWHVKQPTDRVQEIQGNPKYRNVKRYKA
jgi:hypothetical protein